MSTQTINIHTAQPQWNDLLSLVMQGTEIVFAKNNKPLARLIPISQTPSQARIAGLHEGEIWISDDFDEPLPNSFWLGTT